MKGGSVEEITEGELYREQLKRDRFLLELFCHKYGAALTDISVAEESFPKIELLYTFDDGLGGYTIKGMEKSL